MKRKGKCLIPVRMIPWDDDFLHVAAMVLFGSNITVFEWLKGAPMPTDFVERVVTTIRTAQSGAAGPEDATSPASLTTRGKPAGERPDSQAAQGTPESKNEV